MKTTLKVRTGLKAGGIYRNHTRSGLRINPSRTLL
jgi:hypothetical protein